MDIQKGILCEWRWDRARRVRTCQSTRWVTGLPPQVYDISQPCALPRSNLRLLLLRILHTTFELKYGLVYGGEGLRFSLGGCGCGGGRSVVGGRSGG